MKKTIQAVAASLLCISATASASSLTLHWDASPWNPNPPAGPFNYSVTDGSGTYTGSVSPDRYHGEVTAVTGIDPATLIEGGSMLPVSLFTYCYELTQYFSGGSFVDYQVIPAGSVGGITAATLDFLGAVNSVVPGGFGSYAWLHPANANQAAAIQIGIWETLYDSGGPFNINSGNFFITSDLGSGSGSVGDYLTQFDGLRASTPNLSTNLAIRLASTDAQDQITGIQPISKQTVPEPGSLALLALGLAASGIALRRRARA